MGIFSREKINRLQHLLPEALLVDAAWLQRHGYSAVLRKKYVQNHWLDQPARGVYRRPVAQLPGSEGYAPLHWQDVVVSLQTVLRLPVTVGGRTALELQGFRHYVSQGPQAEIHLYSERPLPSWVSQLNLATAFRVHNALRLFKLPTLESVTRLPGHGDWSIVASTPERAILELIDEIPQNETFHQVDMMMEGLTSLSPRRLNILLTNCRSVKVKRLFLWFATRHNHAWLKRLDRDTIDLGRGKRMIIRGGKLDKAFNITVPENLDAGG